MNLTLYFSGIGQKQLKLLVEITYFEVIYDCLRELLKNIIGEIFHDMKHNLLVTR